MPKFNCPIEAKTRIPIKRISLAQMEERKNKRLCYNCDDKWAPGHKCKSAKLFLLEGVEIVLASTVQITEMEEDGIVGVIKSQDEGIEEVEITLFMHLLVVPLQAQRGSMEEL